MSQLLHDVFSSSSPFHTAAQPYALFAQICTMHTLTHLVERHVVPHEAAQAVDDGAVRHRAGCVRVGEHLGSISDTQTDRQTDRQISKEYKKAAIMVRRR